MLFVGDSQLKYLHHVLKDDSSVRFSSGFRGEKIMALLSGVVLDFRTIAIHVGTNKIPHKDPSIILHRYRYLEGQPQHEDHHIRNSTATSTVLKERVTTLDSLTASTERPRKSKLDQSNWQPQHHYWSFLSTQPLASTD